MDLSIVTKYFGFNEYPFTVTADPKFLFFSTQVKEALSKCEFMARSRLGPLYMYGQRGSGKTTLVKLLFKKLSSEPQYNVKLYVAANIKTSNAFLRDILEIFEVKTERSYSASLKNFEKFLVEQAKAGKVPVLLVDEAQNLSKDMLKLIHYLLNFETDKVKLLQVVLVGQEELGTKIIQFRELASRMFPISMSTMILEDMRDMITYRLKVAGYNESIIQNDQAEEAYKTLYAYTKGLPRDAVRVCSLLLIALSIKRLKHATVDMVVQAAKDSNLFT